METDPLEGLLILIVEDSYLIAASLAQGLEKGGAIVVGPVGNVAEAFAALDPLPHLAVLDVWLGKETSFPIADELARLGVPFVFATGTASVIPVAHLRRIVCSKPYTLDGIKTALRSALAP